MKKLNLLEDEEEIKYFYSDGLLDIREGLFMVTDRRLTLYMRDWEEPETLIDFKNISYLDVEYDESFWEDTYITVRTHDGVEVIFPVSSEFGRDKLFFDYLESKTEPALEPEQVVD